MFLNYLKLLRSRQWTKNIFILLPVLFGEVWKTMPPERILVLSGSAFAAFCMWSSAGYILNDIFDRHADATHPRKKKRPIASGKISIASALGFALLLVCLGGAAAIHLPRMVSLIGVAYLLNTMLYCVWLKKQVLLDVFSIALGFVLRVLAGCAALSLVPSNWILVCTFTLAIFLGFGKRRMEVACLTNGQETDFRAVLAQYSSEYLNFLLSVSGTVSLMAYLLYTLSPETFTHHETQNLIYSVPFVFYGVFRYSQDAMNGLYDGPDEVLLHDRPFLICAFLWVLSVAWILAR